MATQASYPAIAIIVALQKVRHDLRPANAKGLFVDVPFARLKWEIRGLRRDITHGLSQDLCRHVLLWRLAPAEPQSEREIPKAHEQDRNRIGSVNIERKEVHLRIEQQNTQAYSSQANEIEFSQATPPGRPGFLQRCHVSKSPHFIPSEIVNYCNFSSARLT